MKNMMETISYALHSLGSYTNRLSHEYAMNEDDKNELYNCIEDLASDVYSKINNVQKKIDEFKKLDLVSLNDLSVLLSEKMLSSEPQSIIYQDIKAFKEIIDFVIENKKKDL